MQRGFTLLEMLVTLSLIAMMGAVAVPISRWAILNMGATQSAASAASRLDVAIQALRRDIWQAQAIDTSSPQTLVLTCADGHKINWQFSEPNLLRRNDAAGNQVWNDIATGISCTSDGCRVIMTIPDTPRCRGGTICFISQTMLYRREQQ